MTAVLTIASASLGFIPLAHATADTTLTPSTEAWYQPNPTCAQASGCLTPGTLPVAPPAEIPLSPYPTGTLHVGFAAGQETSRTYLALPVETVAGSTLTAATLDIPLDTAQANGSQSPETAKIVACLFTDTITPTDGSIAPPPTASCDKAATVTYIATPAPHLHADLAPLTKGLLTTAGIALLPDATKAAQSDAWRVVFSAHTRTDAAKTPPASVTLSFAEPAGDVEVTVPATGNHPLGEIQPPLGTGFAPAPAVESPGDIAPTQVPQVNVNAIPMVTPRTITVGYAYPAVWLLPLVLLVLVPVAARALTRDLTPA